LFVFFSGKTTLLPGLLVAEGYDKVIVTQPRRLPCQLICKRVNKTMIIDVGSSSEKIAGWAVSGVDQNPQAKILYLTDGLLKERLLYDKNFITTHTQLNKSVVFFIDEVHERSVNIDLCLALLARLLTTKPELKSKMKVIISSATLDSSVPTLFRQIPRVDLAEFKMPQMGTLHSVTKNPRPNENILDLVQELCKKRKRHDQILCFVSSVSDVNQCCRLIGEISRGTIVAYPLVQSQHPNVQQTNIEHGTVFFSTTVAETSLTFPSLKYVIDTGMINVPVYDIQSQRTVLKEVRAAESTIKQRLGRLGRTQPGEYYSLYSFKVDDVLYPIPQICQSDLLNIEFSLRKSPLQRGLNYMKAFLPNKPSQESIDATIQQLRQLRK
jgi:HrpA-like RNA helicase